MVSLFLETPICRFQPLILGVGSPRYKPPGCWQKTPSVGLFDLFRIPKTSPKSFICPLVGLICWHPGCFVWSIWVRVPCFLGGLICLPWCFVMILWFRWVNFERWWFVLFMKVCLWWALNNLSKTRQSLCCFCCEGKLMTTPMTKSSLDFELHDASARITTPVQE